MKKLDYTLLGDGIWDWISPEPNTGCWLWTGSLETGGYGRISRRMAHRVIFELLIGPIPGNLVLDHLCRQRSCVNPAHMEPVTSRVNIKRGLVTYRAPTCGRGHPFTSENTRLVYGRERPERICKTCSEINRWNSFRSHQAAIPDIVVPIIERVAAERKVSPQTIAREMLESWANDIVQETRAALGKRPGQRAREILEEWASK